MTAKPAKRLRGMTASRKSRRPARGKRTVRMWGGFCEGRLDDEEERYSGARVVAIFRNRVVAKQLYQDVRPVTVTYSNPKPKRRTRG